ncbi:MAG TPA: hypothetical protein VK155_03255 [Bacteroidales bacterium]|nr:hypothetical protein [Bacteroidales bacterium]
MKKILLLISILLTANIYLSAQKDRDALFLRDGSIIYGRLQEVTSETYRIRMYDGSIMVYPATQVEKYVVVKDTVFHGRKKKGFGFALESGLLIGSQGSKYNAPFSFSFLAGYTGLTKNIMSIGSGVEFIGRPYTPLFFEYRYIMSGKKTSPFAFCRLGGLISLGDDEDYPANNQGYNNYIPFDYKGGFSAGFGSGISWTKEDYETYLSFAYRYAKTSYKQNEGQYKVVTYRNNLNRLEVKLGFRF